MSTDPGDESRLSALKRRLRERVATLAVGDRLPGLRTLGAAYDCSLGLVQMAVNQLIAEGLLVSQARRGVFVAATAQHLPNVVLVLPTLRLEQMDHIIRGARMGLDGTDFQLVVQAAHTDVAEQVSLIDRLDPSSCAGVIICPPTNDSYAPHIQAVQDRGIPAVQATHVLSGVELDSVVVDAFRFGALGIEHLVGRGHRRIGVVGSHRDSATGRQIDDGIRTALATAGIADAPIADLGGFGLDAERPWRSSEVVGGRMLDAHRELTAILCVNQHGVYGLARAARERGLAIPDDLSLLAMGVDLPAFQLHQPPLSLVEQSLEEICRCAAQRLVHLIEGGAGGAVIETVPPNLIERESVRGV